IKRQVDGELAAGTFDFAKWFPDSKKARGIFAPPPPPPAPAGPPSFGTFAREFLELKKPFGSNAYHLDRLSLLETHLLPHFGADRSMAAFQVEDVERFIGHLKTLPGLKAATLSAVRINKSRNLLRQLLDRAVK